MAAPAAPPRMAPVTGLPPVTAAAPAPPAAPIPAPLNARSEVELPQAASIVVKASAPTTFAKVRIPILPNIFPLPYERPEPGLGCRKGGLASLDATAEQPRDR